MRTGIAHLPLHYGKTPSWLFSRMKLLAREITIAIVEEFGPDEIVRRLSDPFWFQAFGCVLGFDWHSSGVTTTVCSALKEGLKGLENDLGVYITGGKGSTSRKTPTEIRMFSNYISVDPEPLIYASKMSAKVDNTAVQDGYQLYHHSFIFTQSGLWTVVQQGMNVSNRYARRYHWLSETFHGTNHHSFVNEPHTAVCCDIRGETLNLVARESEPARRITTQIACEHPEKSIRELKTIQRLDLPSRHSIVPADINPDRLTKILLRTYEQQPQNFEQLLGIEGVGPKTVRALSLISELVYGIAPSFRDPVRYSFAHGGKDGHPYPVDRNNYDQSIAILHQALKQAKLGNRDKMDAFKRLHSV
ncbi:MAG: DUF763 domain-containing protein [bacterium]|nr:DUF763 domain-containing protein [bacterium]